MATINELKQEMDFMGDFKNIIEVFKSTALMQFRSFQETKVEAQQYYQELLSCVSLFCRTKQYNNLFTDSVSLKTLIVVVTSDAGFVGDLNNKLISNALESFNASNTELFVLGSRGSNYLHNIGIKPVELPGIKDQFAYSDSDNLVMQILDGFGDRFDKISVFYPKFVSLAVQKVTEKKLLPFETLDLNVRQNVEVEAPTQDFFKELLAQYLKYNFYNIFYSAKLSEYAARIMHLESSGVELNNLNDLIRHKYFKEAHARNDKSIREISASKLMMGRNK